MPITVSAPDALRQAVEAATGGHNTVLYDDKGYPSVMVVIPRFRMDAIDPALPATVHPAFVVHGVEKSEVFIGKYSASIHDLRAVSLPGQVPEGVAIDQARAFCTSKGQGWHLMTNPEWAALSLLAYKRGTVPRGNTNFGASFTEPLETARRLDGGEPGSDTAGREYGSARHLTGSGPATWTHTRDLIGVADLVGNAFEWVAGIRLMNGEIQVLRDNDGADRYADQSAASPLWSAISAAGAYVATGTAGTMKYDSTGVLGPSSYGAELSDQIRNPLAGATSAGATFKTLPAHAGVVAPPLLKALSLFPLTGTEEGVFWVRNDGERVIARGGSYASKAVAGLSMMAALFTRASNGPEMGFRVAYVAP